MKARLESFSDNVFAVAITLLAFDVRLPQLPLDVSDYQLRLEFLALVPRIFVYAMTFVLVGMFWIAHHRSFTLIQYVDRNLEWINMLLLLFICLLPFSAATLGAHYQKPSAVLFYGCNLVLINQSLFWMMFYASKSHFIVPTTSKHVIKTIFKRILASLPIYLLGMACAFWRPILSSAFYLSALIFYLLPAKIDKHFDHRA